jgi:hypothetical protein
MHFQISALPAAPFAPYFGQSETDLARHNVRRVTATAKPGFPCRVSLRDAELGETLLLLNYEHQNAPTPYRASHAIFVREYAEQAHPAINKVPEVLRHRLLSVRAFDVSGMLIDAEVVAGSALETAMARMLTSPTVSYLHLHNAKPGCYAARVDRA